MNENNHNSSLNTLAILVAIIAGFVLIALLFGRGGHGGFRGHRFGCEEIVPVYHYETVRFEPAFHCFPHRIEIFHRR